MGDSFERQPFPRPPLIAAAALIIFVFAVILLARFTGLGKAADDQPGAVRAERSLLFEDGAGGAVTVRDARTGAPILTLVTDGDGFIRATLRSLVRERRTRGIGAEQAFELTSYADGRLTLLDPATGQKLDLEAFGPSNAGAFARLLPTPATP